MLKKMLVLPVVIVIGAVMVFTAFLDDDATASHYVLTSNGCATMAQGSGCHFVGTSSQAGGYFCQVPNGGSWSITGLRTRLGSANGDPPFSQKDWATGREYTIRVKGGAQCVAGELGRSE